METSRSVLWRGLFVLSGALIAFGGSRHPRGSILEMLQNPDWTWSHSVAFVGFVILIFGLTSFGRATSPPPRTARWLKWARIGTVLQAIEMAAHTLAVVDADHLAAHASTPVLHVHLTLAVLFYPIFAATMIGFIVATVRDRSLGTPWLSWLGILGVACHGIAPLLVVALPALGGTMPPYARLLFPMILLFTLWLIITALWPLRGRSAAPLAPAVSGA